MAYLMRHHGMRLREAYNYVRERRSIARPRKEFVGQLQKIEKEVFGCEKPSLMFEETVKGTTLVNVDSYSHSDSYSVLR